MSILGILIGGIVGTTLAAVFLMFVGIPPVHILFGVQVGFIMIAVLISLQLLSEAVFGDTK